MAETTETSTPKTSGKTAKPAARKTPAAKKATAATTTAISISPVVNKTQEKKSTVTPAKAVRKKAPSATISVEDRQRLIAEAAYLRAERRNFVGGDPVTDWLEAEADISARLKGPTH
jgi:hypothetical protein